MPKQLLVLALGMLLALVVCSPAAPTAAPVAPTPAANIPYPEVPRIPVEEARDRWESGNVVIVDVRSRAEFEQAHIPSAVHIPVAEIDSRSGELPSGVAIITYCT
jgi:3-mercaptopyruvate sulfurtransferase SseA